ncbi:MAG TPA: ATP-binding protein [Tepidisphaeraceae bacterium]|jgi:signal transduction histidine kinase|nr:ATP-binding protein [Tepidisphaeraceae bacterium]
MPPFLWGILTGLICGLAVAVIVGAGWSRRYVALQKRARQVERLAELGTLTGGLAHEIKNPLSTIQLNLQLLREDLPETSGRLINRLNTVQKEASRLREYLDDFMRFAGKIELSRSPVDVYNLLDELVDFYTPQAQLQRVQIRIRRADHPVIANLDERLVKQAVLNLMINALQAMPEQGGEIILSIRQEPGHVMIEVTDTGAGIAPEAVARIFDAYYSTKKGGAGLGLAISRRIAEEHGGTISVASEQGKGSVFTLDFPVVEIPPSP